MVRIIVYAVCFSIAALIVLTHLSLAAGVVLTWFRDRHVRARLAAGPVAVPDRGVSVVVISRDEEAVLPRLLESLEDQSVGALEIVLVDDRSEDRTAEIMEQWSAASRHTVSVLHNTKDPAPHTGKVQGLDLAVAVCTRPLILFTDSDCVVPPRWVEAHVAYYQDPRIGAVFGQFTLERRKGFLHRYQCFDQQLIHQYSTATAGLGRATGCFGRNLSARRDAITAVGGFMGLGYTVTEDAALVSSIAGNTSYRVAVSSVHEMEISSTSMDSWRGFLNQHVRWNTGAFYSRDLSTSLSYRFVVLYLVASLLALPLGVFLPLLPILAGVSFVTIGLLALLSCVVYRGRGAACLLRLVPYTLFFVFFYALVTILAIVKRPLEWKGSRLRNTD